MPLTSPSPRPSPPILGSSPGRKGKPFLAALAGERQPRPPIWLMRQAGRYLPEYRAIRARAASFLDFCYTPALAVEATLQPIRRFGFDAAILFSDILVVPDALGQSVAFDTGEGPRLDPIGDAAGLARLRDEPDWTKLAPVFETLDRLRTLLPAEVALIGFCGAPWTVASYMVAGRGTPDQAPARLFAYRQPKLFSAADRPPRRRFGRISAASAGGRGGGGADLRFLGGRPAAGGVRALVRRPGRLADRDSARQGAACADHRLPARRGDAAREIRRHSGHRRGRPRHCGRAGRRRRRAARPDRPAGQSRSAGAGRGRRWARRGS